MASIRGLPYYQIKRSRWLSKARRVKIRLKVESELFNKPIGSYALKSEDMSRTGQTASRPVRSLLTPPVVSARARAALHVSPRSSQVTATHGRPKKPGDGDLGPQHQQVPALDEHGQPLHDEDGNPIYEPQEERLDPQDGQELPPLRRAAPHRTIADYDAPNQYPEDRAAIRVPNPPRRDYEIKPQIIGFVKKNKFHGLNTEHPMDHIDLFEEICSTTQSGGVPDDYLKCKLFPFSLSDKAHRWLKSLPPGSINNWEGCMSTFLNHFYTKSRSNSLRNKLQGFQQGPVESFHEAWERFKDYERDCPHHGFPEGNHLSTFYRGLHSKFQLSLDTASNGDFTTKTVQEGRDLIENLATSNSNASTNFDRTTRSNDSDAKQIAELKGMMNQLLRNQNRAVNSCETIGNGNTEAFQEFDDTFNQEEEVNYVGTKDSTKTEGTTTTFAIILTFLTGTRMWRILKTNAIRNQSRFKTAFKTPTTVVTTSSREPPSTTTTITTTTSFNTTMEDLQDVQDTQDVKSKGPYNKWSGPEHKMILRLLVEAINQGFPDASGKLNKLMVETRILPTIHKQLGTNKTYTDYKNGMKILKAHPNKTNMRDATFDDFEDLRLIFGSNVASGRNAVGLGDSIDVDASQVGDDDETHDLNRVHIMDDTQGIPYDETSMLDVFSSLEKSRAEKLPQRKKARTNAFSANMVMDEVNTVTEFGNQIVGMIQKRWEKEAEEKEVENKANNVWDAIKETPDLDMDLRYETMTLVHSLGMKSGFMHMSTIEHVFLPEEDVLEENGVDENGDDENNAYEEVHGTMKICEDQREATTMLRLLSDQSKQEVDSGLTHEKVQSNLFHYVYERPLTALIHLSCAKSIETHVGNKETHVDPKEGSTTNDVVQQYPELLIYKSVSKENEIVTNNILLQEEPPDQPSNQQTELISKDTLTEDLSQVSTNKEHTEHKGDSLEVRIVTDQIQNQSEPAPLMLTPSIMETRRVSNSFLIKEEPPDFKAQAQTREGVKQATRQLKAPDQNKGVILSFLLKGEPPDAPCISKPPPYQDMPRIWRLYNRVRGVALSRDMFQFIFKFEEDLAEILKIGVWTQDEWCVVMEKWIEKPPDDYLMFLPVWIRLRNIPVNYYTKDTIEEIAECVGQVLEVIFDLEKSQVQDYVRVRVLFPVSNPLHNSKEVQLQPGEVVSISFDYERVRKRCFQCQRLTHDKNRSSFKPSTSILSPSRNLQGKEKQQDVVSQERDHFKINSDGPKLLVDAMKSSASPNLLDSLRATDDELFDDIPDLEIFTGFNT
ncbi:hypothetical protein ISN45_Aa02g011310 [Arabidopsis thaliana x Arabidopsis arenosa]|uniref:Retrotransposon gag domain-containing protein n=1 Tax=Arabidopsis thaliana x Arabidopsis arenosa TaxID=1240361 RepID=A0A8T2BJW5_9BRAS|nr:hypothetical protein ISN45_Aa02g011310 [Arabidopsis thaliana x Arabidopsis arenosa]